MNSSQSQFNRRIIEIDSSINVVQYTQLLDCNVAYDRLSSKRRFLILTAREIQRPEILSCRLAATLPSISRVQLSKNCDFKYASNLFKTDVPFLRIRRNFAEFPRVIFDLLRQQDVPYSKIFLYN